MTKIVHLTHDYECEHLLGKYSILYADPPWRFQVYNRNSGLDKSPDRHYQTMMPHEIAELPIANMADKNALLAMWVYDPLRGRLVRLGAAADEILNGGDSGGPWLLNASRRFPADAAAWA